MKPIFMLALLLVAGGRLHAQTETDIRKHYQEVNKQINESKKLGYEGPLYQNRWISNATEKAWPAVGRYADTTDFWYDDPPDHLPVSERDPVIVLVKIETNRRASHYAVHEEFLFKEGKLIFYYRNEAEEGHGWETRLWFNQQGVLKTNVRVNELEVTAAEPEYADVAPDIEKIKKEAQALQELFVKSML